MNRIAIALAAGLLAVGVTGASAQEDLLTEMYGRGVHAYFAGQYQQAHALFTGAVDGGLKDPRCFYFRGLAYRQLGREEQAETDFAQGAKLEAQDHTGLYGVSHALQRVQGKTRVIVEGHRARARLAEMKANRRESKAIYEKGKADEGAVLRPKTNPDGLGVKGGDTNLPVKPAGGQPLEDNPFGDTTTPPADTTTPPADTTKPAETTKAADNPFGDEPADTTKPEDTAKPADDAKPADNPFGDQPADDTKPDDTKPADDAPADNTAAADDKPVPGLGKALKGIFGRMTKPAEDALKDLGGKLPLPGSGEAPTTDGPFPPDGGADPDADSPFGDDADKGDADKGDPATKDGDAKDGDTKDGDTKGKDNPFGDAPDDAGDAKDDGKKDAADQGNPFGDDPSDAADSKKGKAADKEGSAKKDAPDDNPFDDADPFGADKK